MAGDIEKRKAVDQNAGNRRSHLAVLVSILFWYGGQQKENDLDLHSIQGEDGSFSDEPDFDLNFE